LAAWALLQELRRPAAERTWTGTVAGVVPYDFRRPTLARIRQRLWAPDNPRAVDLRGDVVGGRMPGFVETDVRAARKAKRRRPAPSRVGDRTGELHPPFCQLIDRLLDVVAHQVQLMPLVGSDGMERELSRRQPEDEPALAGVDVGIGEYIPEEGAIGFRVPRVDDHMRTVDHGRTLPRPQRHGNADLSPGSARSELAKRTSRRPAALVAGRTTNGPACLSPPVSAGHGQRQRPGRLRPRAGPAGEAGAAAPPWSPSSMTGQSPAPGGRRQGRPRRADRRSQDPRRLATQRQFAAREARRRSKPPPACKGKAEQKLLDRILVERPPVFDPTDCGSWTPHLPRRSDHQRTSKINARAANHTC